MPRRHRRRLQEEGSVEKASVKEAFEKAFEKAVQEACEEAVEKTESERFRRRGRGAARQAPRGTSPLRPLGRVDRKPPCHERRRDPAVRPPGGRRARSLRQPRREPARQDRLRRRRLRAVAAARTHALEGDRRRHRGAAVALPPAAPPRLDEMPPPLAHFVEEQVLVQAGSPEQSPLRPRFDGGERFGAWAIVRCVRLIEDTEVYQLRRGTELAALKIARVTTTQIKALLKNEATILRHLDGSGIAPRLIESGEHESRPYLIMEWIDGVDAGVAAAQRCNDRASLIELCASIATAYAALHARGVLHGDVNPRNVLAGDRVTLLDFGYSRLMRRRPNPLRGGIHYFFEPEYFAALRRGRGLPPSPAGEQYGVAALLYLLVAGRHYLEFRLERDEMERQAMHEPPLPFAERGIPPWPDVERILARALAKQPSRRFGSMAKFAVALAKVCDAVARDAVDAPLSDEAMSFLDA